MGRLQLESGETRGVLALWSNSISDLPSTLQNRRTWFKVELSFVRLGD